MSSKYVCTALYVLQCSGSAFTEQQGFRVSFIYINIVIHEGALLSVDKSSCYIFKLLLVFRNLYV